ncbi:GntR family transcriptional regulator [Aeromonas australiensis]|uniref:GntR family transcriptional regulator n=1 Tax=Aeromonas australiensis TaxID=1114880 RepID=UPI000693F134|nr:GntR family transcriptional regulator [Aeromonas australiensis]
MQRDCAERLFNELRQRLASAGDEPLYLILAQGLQQAIDRKQLPHGCVLPSERQLSDTLALSRATVVKGLSLLAEQGRVIKQQGKGTVVHAPFIYNLSGGSFTAQLSQLGVLSDRWLARELVLASAEQAALMGLVEGTEIAKIRRVRCVNNDPTSIETTYIPRQFLPRPDLLEGSLYAHWREEGIEPVAQQYQICQQLPSQSESAMLGLPVGMPVLVVLQRSYTAQGELLEVSQSLCRGDSYSFTFNSGTIPGGVR